MNASGSASSVSQSIPTASGRRWNPRWSLFLIAALAVSVWVSMFSGIGSGAQIVATEFNFTGAPRAYVVPEDVCRLRVELTGAAGGPAGTAGAPGAGALAVATFQVRPSETLLVSVGGSGGEAAGTAPGRGGWNGGGDGGAAFDGPSGHAGRAGSGGGGATDIRRGGDSLADRIFVAGGGSGGAGGAIGGALGTGGGDGGDPIGRDGFAAFGIANPATGGEGGTQDSGGAPGRNAPQLSVTATTGSLGAGGNGASGGTSGGGGGGGGLYGGGGGGSEFEWVSGHFGGGHGGGGSSFGPVGTVFRSDIGVGLGRAKISYDPDADSCRNPQGQ